MKSSEIKTTPTEVSEEVKKEFQGMTDKESMEHQLLEWVKGRSLHNPVRNECCPDFSCCCPDGLMDEDVRIKFSNAVKMHDDKTKMAILGMALAGITSSAGLNAHIVGEDTIVN